MIKKKFNYKKNKNKVGDKQKIYFLFIRFFFKELVDVYETSGGKIKNLFFVYPGGKKYFC